MFPQITTSKKDYIFCLHFRKDLFKCFLQIKVWDLQFFNLMFNSICQNRNKEFECLGCCLVVFQVFCIQGIDTRKIGTLLASVLKEFIFKGVPAALYSS